MQYFIFVAYNALKPSCGPSAYYYLRYVLSCKQEQVFDHIFSHLGINTPGSVNHPVVLTEPVCNPNYCRQCE